MNRIKKLLFVLLVSVGITAFPTATFATGSDSPTPYTVDATGVTLPAGATFQDNGHVNVKTNQGDKGIHFESLNNQPSGQWIGQGFLPWSAFGFDTATLCVTWVQLSQYNEHFGEGGQSPVGIGCTTIEEPPVTEEPPVITPPDTQLPEGEPFVEEVVAVKELAHTSFSPITRVFYFIGVTGSILLIIGVGLGLINRKKSPASF